MIWLGANGTYHTIWSKNQPCFASTLGFQRVKCVRLSGTIIATVLSSLSLSFLRSLLYNYCLTRILQPAEKDDEKVRKRESHVVSKRLLDQLLSRELHHHRRSSAKAEWRRKNMHIIKCAQKSQKPSKNFGGEEKKVKAYWNACNAVEVKL